MHSNRISDNAWCAYALTEQPDRRFIYLQHFIIPSCAAYTCFLVRFSRGPGETKFCPQDFLAAVVTYSK